MPTFSAVLFASLLLAPVRAFAQDVPDFKASDIRFLDNYDPTSIRRADGGRLLMEGFLDRSWTMSVRIAPEGVELQLKHFLRPAEEWRRASFGEVQGIRAALKRRTERAGAASGDQPLYRAACQALQQVQPSRQELGAVQAQVEAFLMRPLIPHTGVRVTSVDLGRGKVVVLVESEDQLARAKELVEKRFPDYAPFVEYQVDRGPVPRE